MLNRQNKIVPDDLSEYSAADTIEETLATYHIAHVDFAKRIGVSEKHLSQVLHRKAFISPDRGSFDRRSDWDPGTNAARLGYRLSSGAYHQAHA